MDGSDPGMDWLLVRTQPQREQYAQQNIQHWLGLESYLPLYYDQQIDKIKVLFPSYLFVRSLQWHPFKGVWGVSNVVMVGESPARLSDNEIQGLKAREAEEKGKRVILLPDLYQVGQQLRVLAGSFADHLGLYDGMDGKTRVRVLLEFMGRSVKLSVPRHEVAAVI